MATNPNLVNATAGQRLAARAVDSVPLLVLVLLALMIPGHLALAVCAAAAAAYLLWILLWEAGSGQTPGNRLLGLRTVGEDGHAPGFAAVLVRNLILLASGVTVAGPWILTVSNLWDYPHRRQGWHDKAAHTLMVDIRAGRDPLLTGGRWTNGTSVAPPQKLAVPGTKQAPFADREPFPEPSAASAAAPAAQGAGLAGRIGASLPSPPAPGTAGPAPVRTGWVPQPEDAPGPISQVPGVSARRAAAPVPAPAPAPAPYPAPAPAPAPADDELDVEMTRVVSRPKGGAALLLTFDDGAAVRITGTALLGRNPAAAIGESVDKLIDFADMGRSVSKTHLHLQADAASGLWVTDRNSTNGSSVVAPDGRHTALQAHSPVLAPAGSTVYFGDRHFKVG